MIIKLMISKSPTMEYLKWGEVQTSNQCLRLAMKERKKGEHKIFYFHPYLGKIPILTI